MSSSINGSGVPSPAPSNASGSGSQVKRKRDFAAMMKQTAVEKEREKDHKPQETLTQIQLAVDYLKETNGEKTFDEILNYLSLQHCTEAAIAKLENTMKAGRHHKIVYNPKGKDGKGSFKYRPIIPVSNAEQLRGFLQKRTHAIGVKIDDIKDGWSDCVPELESMQGRGEILLTRGGNKQKGQEQPKTVWANDPSLCKFVIDDLRKQWESIMIPTSEDLLREKLLAAGLKPSTVPKQPVQHQAPQKKKKKPRANARGTATNAHIQLKDYSHLRK